MKSTAGARSPRATMMPSETRRIESAASTAAAVSILAMIRTWVWKCRCTWSRPASTSSADEINERATQSGVRPSAAKLANSSMSQGVMMV